MHSDHQISEKLTASAEAVQLGTFDDSQLLQARKALVTENFDPKVLKFAQYLMEDCPFDRLVLQDEPKRRWFAFAMAQCWLFTRTVFEKQPTNYFFRNCFASPLSVIISSDYELLIDESDVIERLTNKKADDLVVPKISKNLVDYGKRFEIWPFLEELADLPLSGRKTLVLVASASSIQSNLLEFSRIDGDKAVSEGINHLNKKGLLILDVPKYELLALFPYQKVKDFAIQHGIQSIPSNKKELIKLVREECEQGRVDSYVDLLLSDPYYGYAKERFMRLSVPNVRIFEEYVRDELNRLSLYLECIGCVEHDFLSIVVPVSKLHKRSERPGDPYQRVQSHENLKRAFSPDDFIARVNPRDLRTIRKFWDGQCDALVSATRDESANWSTAISSAAFKVMSYWDEIGVLKQFQFETRNQAYETHWHWVLDAYVSYQLTLDDRYQLRPIKRVCNGCGCTYKEWSVGLEYVLRVGRTIEFCNACYGRIFNHRFMANTTKASQVSSEAMLTYLWELSRSIGFIPTRTYMESIELPVQPPERQVKVGKILLEMPAYDIYIERFGNWFRCLTLAGILDDGHKSTSRGIQCLSRDGHLCLSLGEKAVDDWLTDHGIAHEKEIPYPYDEHLNPNRLARADWKVGCHYIEYAGLMDDSAYAQKMQRKQQLAVKHRFDLIIIGPADLFLLDGKLAPLLSM